jgi:hypothetical protein
VIGFTTIDVCAKWLNPQIGVGPDHVPALCLGLDLDPAVHQPLEGAGAAEERTADCCRLVRGLLLLNSTWMNFIAMQYLQLAQTVSIGFMAPLMVSLLAGPMLGEWAGPRRIIAIAVGFMGVLIITRPGSGAIHSAALLSVLGMFSYACMLLMTRRLTAVDSPETTMFYSSLAGAVILAPIALMSWKAPGTALEWGVVALCGFGGAVGHWMLIQAQRYTDAPGARAVPLHTDHLDDAFRLPVLRRCAGSLDPARRGHRHCLRPLHPAPRARPRTGKPRLALTAHEKARPRTPGTAPYIIQRRCAYLQRRRRSVFT